MVMSSAFVTSDDEPGQSSDDEMLVRDRFGDESEASSAGENGTSIAYRKRSLDQSSAMPARKLAKTVVGQDKLTARAAAAKKGRKAKSTAVNARIIPKSEKDCDEADKMLLKEANAKTPWQDIRAKWAEITGEKTAKSSLPNRYERLKRNFFTLSPEDKARLIEVKIQIEEDHQASKWDLISQLFGGGHDSKDLQRFHRNMMLKEGIEPPAGIRDPDWDVGV